jgi:hypothetical protein
MKIGFIVPDAYLETLGLYDFHLLLPMNVHKALPYISRSDYIVLDNGAAEGKLVSNSMLLEWVDEYQDVLNEVVAPDVLYDFESTKNLTEDFVNELNDDINVMGVAQGSSWPEVFQCIEWMAQHPRITTLGIPKHLTKTLNHRYARLILTADLIKRERQEDFPEGFHFLGATEWIKEPRALSGLPGVRSMDTSLAALAALRHMSVIDLSERIERTDTFFQYPLSYHTIRWLITNQGIYQRWANE